MTPQEKWDAEAGAYDGIEPRPSEKQQRVPGFNEFLGAVQHELIKLGYNPPLWPDPKIRDNGDFGEALDSCVQWCAARLDAAQSAIPASAIKVLQYVSRGRGYVDIEPYPDAAAREALGEIRAVDSCTVSTRKEAK